MKFLMLFLVLSLGVSAQAVTRAQFVGPYGIIRIVAKDYSGMTDTDGQILFEQMNVPVRDSIIGPGKSIEAADKGLQFICANRHELGFECSIFVHKKGHGAVNASRKLMQYKVEGPEADIYSKLFKVDEKGQLLFVSQEGYFKVEVKPQYFEVLYYEGGGRPESTFEKPPGNLNKTLVVVNIEDTLKVSHVQHFWDSLNYNNDTKKKFLGMEGALNLLLQQDSATQFYYLAQGPELMAGLAEREFIKRNDFPKGRFLRYRRHSSSGERLGLLRSLMEQTKPTQVIVISHNGGPDPEVFNDLASEFSEIAFKQYFHIVYSTSSLTELGSGLFPYQIGYVTAAELVADWRMRELTRPAQSLRFSRDLVKKVLGSGQGVGQGSELVTPDFLLCDDFQWIWPTAGDYQYLTALRDYLRNRCYTKTNENKIPSPSPL